MQRLCSDGLAPVRRLRCVPMGSRLRVGCAVIRWARACALAALSSPSTVFEAAGRGEPLVLNIRTNGAKL